MFVVSGTCCAGRCPLACVSVRHRFVDEGALCQHKASPIIVNCKSRLSIPNSQAKIKKVSHRFFSRQIWVKKAESKARPPEAPAPSETLDSLEFPDNSDLPEIPSLPAHPPTRCRIVAPECRFVAPECRLVAAFSALSPLKNPGGARFFGPCVQQLADFVYIC